MRPEGEVNPFHGPIPPGKGPTEAKATWVFKFRGLDGGKATLV